MMSLGLVRRVPLEGANCLPWLARILAHQPESAARDLRRGVPTVAELTRFAAVHRLGPLLSQAADHSALRRFLPEALRQSWQDTYVRQWMANQLLLYKLRGIPLAFSEAGTDFLLLKGPYLAHRFYGDLAQRTFEDIDLLVRPEQAGPCLRWLRSELGFSSSALFHPLLRGFSPLLRSLTHAKSVRRGDLTVDLHWALRCHPSFAIDDARLWATRQVFALPGRGEESINVPADEYVLVLTLLGIFDDLSRLLIPIKGLVDAFLILRAIDAVMDWPDFLARRRTERLHWIVVDVLAMILELFEGRELLPRLAGALEKVGQADCLGLKVVLRQTNRAQAIWSYRLRLYDMPRSISFLHFLAATPIKMVLF